MTKTILFTCALLVATWGTSQNFSTNANQSIPDNSTRY
jgi:hypothetical protein